MQNQNVKKPLLVAHRGYAKKFPENSMSGFSAAIECGIKYLELDVQLTRDLVPCVIHDDNMQRTSGHDVDILNSDWQSIQDYCVGEDDRLSGKYPSERLTSLKDFVIFLEKYPDVHAFVELKEESIARFGKKTVIKQVVEVLEPIASQCAIISFDISVLLALKKEASFALGFVVHAYDEEHLILARQLNPDIIICNYKKIPDNDSALWDGAWEWMLYEVTDPEVAKKWSDRGVKYIETMAVLEMMQELNLR